MKLFSNMIENLFSRRFHAAIFGLSFGIAVCCSCRSARNDSASMKLGQEGDRAYVLGDRSAFQGTPSKQSFALPRLADTKANAQPANADDSDDAEILQTAYTEKTPPIPRENCPPMGPDMERGQPLPYEAYGPWSPPAIRQPWPQDEYLRDGGDRQGPAGVGREWQVYGVEMEDAVAHYDTVDGRRIVEPSNEVFIYSPRFGAVRQVVGLVANEQWEASHGVTENTVLDRPTHTQLVGSTKQNVQPNNRIGARPPHAFRMKQGDGAVSTVTGPRGFSDGFKPYENIAVIRTGEYENSEGMLLARSSQAAVAWIDTQSLQVIVDNRAAQEAVKDEKLESVYRVETEEGHPILRLIKVASTPFAKPGEEVWFTLRFDNMGNQPLGNVTIIDSLSTRLEYVADSAQCSREAKFIAQPNEGDSTVLRCEVNDPLEPGEGGVIRFRCVVR